ncbi:MAG: phosphatidylserine decarboxylase [SAR324 cluster bacterium]|nr:phosphatidylserine decarboxylase [SAR324 cluster bacterium]
MNSEFKLRPLSYYLLWLLPKNLFSRLCGTIANLELPPQMLQVLIRAFIRAFKIDMSEYIKGVEEYRTFNEFFTRQLKPDARTIDPRRDALISPVDGTIGEYGDIVQGILLQAKGITYTLSDLLNDHEKAREYEGGKFMTIYLAPHNYHRIHSMADGEILHFTYIPGALWTVSAVGVKHIPGLFARNERIISYIQMKSGECALVKVGATIVGKIKVRYSEVESNTPGVSPGSWKLNDPYPVRRGEELGLFEMGSTVVCLYKRDQIKWDNVYIGKTVRMGNVLGFFKQ